MIRHSVFAASILVSVLAPWQGLAAQTAVPARRLATPIQRSASGAATIQRPVTGTTTATQLPAVAGPDGAVLVQEATPVDPEEQIASQRQSKLRTVRFDRRPSAILMAWSKPPEAEAEPENEEPGETEDPPAEPDPVQEAMQALDDELKQLSRAVTLGDWAFVGSYLSDSLEEEDATILYEQMLQALSRAPDSVPTDLPPDVQQQLRQFKQMQAQQQRGQPEVNVIDWDVVMSLAAIAPKELEEKQLTLLGRMASQALRQGHTVEAWVDRLKGAIASPPEGSRPLDARMASVMLIGAGRAIEAGQFLPSVEQLQEAKDLQGLNLLTQNLLARYRADDDRELLKQAWQTTQAVLAMVSEDEDKSEKEKALRQAVDLAPQVEETLGQQWLNDSFQGDAARGKEILASIGSGAAKGLASSSNNSSARLKTLELQNTAVDALLDASPDKAKEWGSVLSILAMNWLREADVSYRYDRSTSLGPMMQRDSFGNIYYMDSRSMGMSGQVNRGISAIETGRLLELKPDARWIELVEQSLRPEFQKSTAKLYLKVGHEEEALPFIEQLAEEYPSVAQDLVDEFLRVWTRNHDPNSSQNRTSSYLYVYGFQQRAQSIPLTRSKQERNLEELAQLVTRLRELPVELDERLMQRAFTTCHSSAEVYRLEAIEKVFGQLESIDPKTLAGLAQGMRSNLGGLWREPATQETAKTKRKKKDIQAEVERGYQVARNVVTEAITRFPENWSLHLALAAIEHDENNYRREVAPSSEFVENQQNAFADFEQAARLYLDQVEGLRQDEYTVEPFQLWFYASLGACDLRQINEEKRPDLSQPSLIRQAMDSMPGPIAEKHLAMFANDLFTRMSAVSPGVKFRYLRGGFEIVGDHEQAREAQRVFDYYKDLVTEIELRTVIDGSDVVGHNKPFGVFVNLRHTVEIERESGGFSRYLQNQNTGTRYYYNYGRPLENYRDKFEEMAREALGEHFDILSVTFQSEDVNSRATEVDGWRITPYAYLLLKARDPKVDKLPPIRLDLDFMDTSGYVVLPIESPVLPVVAAQEPPELRPVDQIAVTQTLDERQANEGKLILEVKATATGLVPELDELMSVDSKGFEVAAVDDQGLSVARFDPESEENTIVSERSWLVTFTAANSASQMPTEYTFADLKLETDESLFQRYEDADLVSVPATIQLEKRYGKQSYAWILWLTGIFVVGSTSVVLVLVFMPRKSAVVEQRTMKLPDQLTPFSVLALLEEIDQRGSFAEGQRMELREAMLNVERSYFGDTNGDAKPDLQKVAQEWVERYAEN